MSQPTYVNLYKDDDVKLDYDNLKYIITTGYHKIPESIYVQEKGKFYGKITVPYNDTNNVHNKMKALTEQLLQQKESQNCINKKDMVVMRYKIDEKALFQKLYVRKNDDNIHVKNVSCKLLAKVLRNSISDIHFMFNTFSKENVNYVTLTITKIIVKYRRELDFLHALGPKRTYYVNTKKDVDDSVTRIVNILI